MRGRGEGQSATKLEEISVVATQIAKEDSVVAPSRNGEDKNGQPCFVAPTSARQATEIHVVMVVAYHVRAFHTTQIVLATLIVTHLVKQ
eukprot:SAG11_NODE_12553_length_697_cov_1.299331_2_plen_89_part_00